MDAVQSASSDPMRDRVVGEPDSAQLRAGNVAVLPGRHPSDLGVVVRAVACFSVYT
jgi:hypothetical protein